MDDTVIAGHLENLDRRLARVEQILPTFVTKEELREEGERSRRHMDVVGEALRTDIQLLAEHLASMRPKPRKG